MSTRVLVVDDEPAVCRMVQTVLESMGVESETLCDSAQAEVAVQSQKFDAIFVDARMPAPDGLQLVRKIRRSGYNQSTPVVMMTGFGEDELAALFAAPTAGCAVMYARENSAAMGSN